MYHAARTILTLTLVLVLAACSIVPLGDPGPATGQTIIQPVFIATLRSLNAELDSFGAERQSNVSYIRSDISLPPNHRIGQIEQTRNPSDTRTNFVAVDGEAYGSTREFMRAVNRDDTPNKSQVMVFVHGYNVDQVEAKFRLAQITQDFDVPMPTVLFSWPSAGDVRGYV